MRCKDEDVNKSCNMGPDQGAQRTDLEQSWDEDEAAGGMKVGNTVRGALETGVLSRHAVGGGVGWRVGRL